MWMSFELEIAQMVREFGAFAATRRSACIRLITSAIVACGLISICASSNLAAQQFHAGDRLYWTLDGSMPSLATPNFFTLGTNSDTIQPPPIWIGTTTTVKGAVYRPSTQQWSEVESIRVVVLDPLPIELLYFTGSFDGDLIITMRWRTATERNNFGFRLERDGVLLPIFIPGHGTTNEPHDYSFSDTISTRLIRVRYRLEQVDLDGTTWWSQPIVFVIMRHDQISKIKE